MAKSHYRSSFGEEVANSTSHGAMALIALAFIPVAAVHAYIKGGILDSVGVSIFASAIFLMFLASTLYHAMALDSRHKAVFKILDHIFIYVAIAGSYTPIALSVIGGWQGWLVFGVQWAMVLFGILYKSISRNQIPKVSLTIYLIMGWTLVLFFPIFLAKASTGLMVLLLTGGVFYSGGAAVYAKKGFKYHHMVWHLFINLGAAAHAIGIVFFLK